MLGGSAFAQDCNDNGVPDDQDIMDGTSNDCNGNSIPDECEFDYTTYTFDVNLPIPDGGTVTDTQFINDSGEIGDVNVHVVIDHTFLGDLTIDVSHNLTTVRLWDQQCGDNDDMDVIFDDAGVPVICGTPTQGTFEPVEPLSAFNGQDLFGEWSITVTDNNANLELGTLVQWELIIGVPIPLCCQGTLLSSDTIPDGGIDAREEHAFGDPGLLTGLDAFEFTFDDSTSIVEECFVICETGGGAAPNVVSVDQLGGNRVRVNLDRPITAGEWTTFSYEGVTTPTEVNIGFLPGDVDQSGTSTTFDITALIDCLNNQQLCADYQVDMDRSGLRNGNDITRLIDILQSPPQDPFPWLNVSLPPEPGPDSCP
jgi:subtilisin-like proprotein convertase family protein